VLDELYEEVGERRRQRRGRIGGMALGEDGSRPTARTRMAWGLRLGDSSVRSWRPYEERAEALRAAASPTRPAPPDNLHRMADAASTESIAPRWPLSASSCTCSRTTFDQPRWRRGGALEAEMGSQAMGRTGRRGGPPGPPRSTPAPRAG